MSSLRFGSDPNFYSNLEIKAKKILAGLLNAYETNGKGLRRTDIEKVFGPYETSMASDERTFETPITYTCFAMLFLEGKEMVEREMSATGIWYRPIGLYFRPTYAGVQFLSNGDIFNFLAKDPRPAAPDVAVVS